MYRKQQKKSTKNKAKNCICIEFYVTKIKNNKRFCTISNKKKNSKVLYKKETFYIITIPWRQNNKTF